MYMCVKYFKGCMGWSQELDTNIKLHTTKPLYWISRQEFHELDKRQQVLLCSKFTLMLKPETPIETTRAQPS